MMGGSRDATRPTASQAAGWPLLAASARRYTTRHTVLTGVESSTLTRAIVVRAVCLGTFPLI
jgi:hypothetical protein